MRHTSLQILHLVQVLVEVKEVGRGDVCRGEGESGGFGEEGGEGDVFQVMVKVKISPHGKGSSDSKVLVRGMQAHARDSHHRK